MPKRIAALVLAGVIGCSGEAGTSSGQDGGGPSKDDASARGDGGTIADAPPTPTATGCKALVHDTASVEGSAADTYRWYDTTCRPRSASLLRNDAKDAFGQNGGYLRTLTYEDGTKTRTCRGTGSNGWQGFGYVVNHYANGASLTRGIAGQTTTVLGGKHHSVHQFKWRVSPGGPVDVTVEWRVSTGRSHPIFAVTFDSGPSGANKTNADARAPYGDMAFEGGAAGPISGIGWGDSHKFTTKGSGPVTATTPWDYTQANTIPYDLSWSNEADAEMGLVATHTFQSGPSAGDYGGGALSQRWGKSGSSLLADIPDWTWPYQLNQYELPFGTTSHRVAWGASYGAVGQSSYASFGRTLSGFPYTSYALRVVFGTHGESAVMAEVGDMEAVTKTTISTTKGAVSTSGAGGPGRTDTVPFARAGWDEARDAWSVQAVANEASIQLDASGATLANPLLVVRDWTGAEPMLTWNGAPLTADVHYFATVDPQRKELWITLGFAVTKGTLDVTP